MSGPKRGFYCAIQTLNIIKILLVRFLSSLCYVLFNSVSFFIVDIPDTTEHKTEVVPLLATVGNALEIKCDVTDSKDVVWERNDVDVSLLDYPGITVGRI